MNNTLDIRRIAVTLIMLSAFIFSIAHLFHTGSQVYVANNDWRASEKWIESAECARTTGVFLAGCIDGKIIPYSQLSLADDVGHAFFLGIYSVATGKILSLSHAGLLNVWINFTGLWLLSAIVFGARQYLAAAAILIGGSIAAGGFTSAAPHAALLGVTSYAMALPLALLLFRSSRLWPLVLTLVIGAAGLAVATLLRQSIGMMGSVAALIAVCVALFTVTSISRRVLIVSIALPLILSASMATTALLTARDALWQVEPGTLIDRHGVQHNLFIGLGVVENSFGIKWDDSYGLAAARAVDPNVEYVSEEYYRILGKEYQRLLLSNPLEVIRIYTLKAYDFLVHPIGGNFWVEMPLFLALIMVSALFVCARISRPSDRLDCIAFIAYLFAGMHLGQAVLINPSMQYGSPIAILFLLIIASSTRIGTLPISSEAVRAAN